MSLNQNLTTISCLNCRDVVEGERSPDTLTCPSCGHSYPVFECIPLLVKESRINLAASWRELEKVLADNGDRLEEVKDALGRQPERAELLNRGIQAYQSDNSYLAGLRDAIGRAIARKEIAELEEEGRLPRQYTFGEGLAFFYRDWCRSEAAESEISTIIDTVNHQLEAYADNVDSVLVPGAGAGRFACELARTFDRVYAFDYSMHMAQIFYDIALKGITIHRVNFRSNVVHTEDVVVSFSLSIPDGEIRSALDAGKLSYFTSNALDTPMPGNSLSAVASIYFIDLVPIKEHMLEARRVLKPGGLFINFGPLRYMRGDVANMLSGEEILDLYSQSGFDILAHDVVPNTQLASSQVITSVHSNNFVFVARKR